jgi:tRNA (guanine37-N1)-methyltransferase
MLAIKIPLKGINEMRKILMVKELMDMNYKLETSNSYGYIPLKTMVSNLEELEKELNNKITGFSDEIAIEIIEKDLIAIKKPPKNLSENLKGKLSTEEIENLKKSFDIIGDIVILEIPKNFEKYKNIIGKSALDFTKRKSVFMKKSGIEGVIRTRKIEHIAGENNSKTIHKEHGMRLSLDIKNVYFSPRLATERKTVFDQVKNGENILDMFAGIGPYSILIAKTKNVRIYAVDINKIAIEYMKENIQLNKITGRIIPFYGDINQIAISFKEKQLKFNRIIMNLPGLAYEFLDLAISLIEDGGTLHYYEFSDNFDQLINRVEGIAIKYNKQIDVLNKRKVKSSSPGMWHMSVDVKIFS